MDRPACKGGWYSQGQILEPSAVCTQTNVLVRVKARSPAVTENLGQNLICRQEIGKLQTRRDFLLLGGLNEIVQVKISRMRGM